MNLIFKSSGIYLGFLSNGYIFSRDGEYLGWMEDNFAWDTKGRFRGQLWNDKYIILNRFAVSPIPRTARMTPPTPALPAPPANTAPVLLPTGWVDSFSV